jgi:glutamate--cysteine ligase
VLRDALQRHGIVTVAAPVDRARPPERVVDNGRYRAMEAYFDAIGPLGRVMMCNTASMQVNVDPTGDPTKSWRAANIAASLLGTFGDCGRRDVWQSIDATRCSPVDQDDVIDAWTRYAFAARVMFVRTDGDDCVPVFDGMTLAEWLRDGHSLGWPSAPDVVEHLTTLFPPVRPRGFFELRTIDMCEDDTWPALAAVAASVVLDEIAARDVVAGGEEMGFAGLLRSARAALIRLGVGATVLDAVDTLRARREGAVPA